MKIEKVFNSYIPMTETAFYILLSLKKPLHGYGIIKHVEELTEGRLRPGFRNNLRYADENAA